MKARIPYPDDPQHADNLRTIALLEAQKFKGIDASLAESVLGYGMAWRRIADEVLFVYQVRPNVFDRCTMKVSLDVRKEYDWVEWPEFCATMDIQDLDKWFTFPLEQKIYDLFCYYGSEEIFGTCYWEGIIITERTHCPGMNAYMYHAALWCGKCVVESCITHGVLSPAARDMDVDRALDQAREANGWTSESDYDSDDFPKGPYPDGGGEADVPNHCDGCHCHLENPLTEQGAEYVERALLDGNGNPEVLDQWAEFYDVASTLDRDEWGDAAKELMTEVAEKIEARQIVDEETRINLINRLKRLAKL